MKGGKMEKDKRTGQLKDLKVGDEVFLIQGRGVWGSYTTISQVQKITPTGKINVDGVQFSPNGSYYSGSNSLWLKELTPESKEEYLSERKRQTLARNISSTLTPRMISELSLEKLERLDDCLKELVEDYKATLQNEVVI